jgi:rare lipoprotein A
MTSKNLYSRIKSAVFVSALLTASMQISLTAYASASPVNSSVDAIDTITYFSQELPTVDSAPDVPFTTEQISQLPDATPIDEPVSKYGNAKTYRVLGQTYTVLTKSKHFKQTGTASWYGKKFHGQRTSSGERFDMFQMTAAHKNLPIPCYARVTNQENGKSVIVKVNDRGPFHASRVMDVSWAAAAKLDMLGKGTAKISIEVVDAVGKTAIAQNTQPTATPTIDNTALFFVQIGAFGAKDNALSLQSKLAEITPMPIEISETTTPNTVHKVQVGPFSDVASAEKARSYLAQLSSGNLIIVKR